MKIVFLLLLSNDLLSHNCDEHGDSTACTADVCCSWHSSSDCYDNGVCNGHQCIMEDCSGCCHYSSGSDFCFDLCCDGSSVENATCPNSPPCTDCISCGHSYSCNLLGDCLWDSNCINTTICGESCSSCYKEDPCNNKDGCTWDEEECREVHFWQKMGRWILIIIVCVVAAVLVTIFTVVLCYTYFKRREKDGQRSSVYHRSSSSSTPAYTPPVASSPPPPLPLDPGGPASQDAEVQAVFGGERRVGQGLDVLTQEALVLDAQAQVQARMRTNDTPAPSVEGQRPAASVVSPSSSSSISSSASPSTSASNSDSTSASVSVPVVRPSPLLSKPQSPLTYTPTTRSPRGSSHAPLRSPQTSPSNTLLLPLQPSPTVSASPSLSVSLSGDYPS